MTERLSLQLALALPGIPDERDSSVQRLTGQLQANRLEKVHVVHQDGLHYDPTLTGRMHAVVSCAHVSIGNLRLFADEVVPDEVRVQVVRLESPGKITMLVRADGAWVCWRWRTRHGPA